MRNVSRPMTEMTIQRKCLEQKQIRERKMTLDQSDNEYGSQEMKKANLK